MSLSRRPAPLLSTGSRLLLPAFLLLAAFFVAPLISVVILSIVPTRSTDVAGIEAYLRIFTDTFYLRVLAVTLLFGAGISILAVVIGYPIAALMTRAGPRERAAIAFMVVAPLLISMVVRAYGWQLVLGNRGLINSVVMSLGFRPLPLIYNWFSLSVSTLHVLLPFAVLSIAGVLGRLDRSVEESAATLGAAPWRVFVLITLPRVKNGIATAAILVFLLALGTFVTVLMLGGPRTQVASLLLYQQVTITFDHSFASALAVSLMLVTVAILLLQFRFFRSA